MTLSRVPWPSFLPFDIVTAWTNSLPSMSGKIETHNDIEGRGALFRANEEGMSLFVLSSESRWSFQFPENGPSCSTISYVRAFSLAAQAAMVR